MNSPKVNLKMQPLLQSVLRAGVAGEFARHVGACDAATIRAVQQAVNEGLIAKLIVVAFNGTNVPRDRYTLHLAKLESDATVHVDLSNGKSYTEALDCGLAGAVAWIVERVKRMQWQPKLYLEWSAKAAADPARLRGACRRYGFEIDVAVPEPVAMPEERPANDSMRDHSPAPIDASEHRDWSPPSKTLLSNRLPETPVAHAYRQVLSVRPHKDPGLTLSIEMLIRER